MATLIPAGVASADEELQLQMVHFIAIVQQIYKFVCIQQVIFSVDMGAAWLKILGSQIVF